MNKSSQKFTTLEVAALAGTVALAAILRFLNLKSLGYANKYYSAAVASMLQSWHNFFFVAAEPGASVSVDKPPIGLWLQAISANFLGVNGFAMLLPQLLAGILAVVLIYYLVRRTFGPTAGLLAGLALALTPIAVATDRNNTMDSTLILTLLLAAWAFIKATETRRMRFLILGGALVGIAFNIKMLQAYLPIPAFFALYLLGSAERLWQKLAKLALASALILVISLSWAVAVDLTPVEQRPYVGSSTDNSVISLIIGYNGVNRLLTTAGQGRSGTAGGLPAGGAQRPGIPPGGGFPPIQPGVDGDAPGRNLQPPDEDNGGRNFNPGLRGAASSGFPGTGQRGALRLFIPPLIKEVGWLLPFGLLSMLLLAFSVRPRWPLAGVHQMLVLWGGWLLAGGVFFSIAGFFHEYYLATIAPPLAALVGIGAVLLWRIFKRRSWLGLVMLLVCTGVTLAFQALTARSFIGNSAWLWLPLAVAVIGAGLLVAGILRTKEPIYQAGFTVLIVAMLIIPAVWSGLTALNPASNQSLPSAYGGETPDRAMPDRGLINHALLDYLQANTQDIKYLLAVPSSMQGADYVLKTGRPVLYMGGFNGSDAVVDAEKLQHLVSSGELRFIFFGGWEGPNRTNTGITEWVRKNCKPVRGIAEINARMLYDCRK